MPTPFKVFREEGRVLLNSSENLCSHIANAGLTEMASEELLTFVKGVTNFVNSFLYDGIVAEPGKALQNADQATVLNTQAQAPPFQPTSSVEAKSSDDTSSDDTGRVGSDASDRSLTDREQEIINDQELGKTAKAFLILILQIERGQITSFEALVNIMHYLNDEPCGKPSPESIFFSEGLGQPSELPEPPELFIDTQCEHQKILTSILMDREMIFTFRYKLPLHRITRYFGFQWPKARAEYEAMREERQYGSRLIEEHVPLFEPRGFHIKGASSFDVEWANSFPLTSHYVSYDNGDLESDGTNEGLIGILDRGPAKMYNWPKEDSDEEDDEDIGEDSDANEDESGEDENGADANGDGNGKEQGETRMDTA